MTSVFDYREHDAALGLLKAAISDSTVSVERVIELYRKCLKEVRQMPSAECTSPQIPGVTSVTTNRRAPTPYIGRGGLIVEGVRLPYIQAEIVEGEQDRADPLVSLICDGRLGHTMPLSEVQSIAWFLGNCMAVAAGFSCVGENSVPMHQGNLYRGDLCC